MTKEQFEAQIDHIGRVYENAKDSVCKQNMKIALDGLQEIRNICCEALQDLLEAKAALASYAGSAEEEKEEFGEWLERCCDPHSTSVKEPKKKDPWISVLKELRIKSVQRAIECFKTYKNVPITYWTTALAGEMGELCNMVKKMERVNNGGIDAGSSYTAASITPEMLKEEIGGIAIYLDLLASLLNIDLEAAIVDTFNEKSVKYGFPYLLQEPPAATNQEGGEK